LLGADAGAPLQMASLASGSATIELVQIGAATDAPVDRPSAGLYHLAFRVSDLDAAVTCVIAAGGQAEAAARVTNAQAKLMICRDPDGTRLLLMQLGT
jgi:predicted enzyme related to lactoylglutathione lyase